MKRGFTLVEAVICLVAISFILITLVHYNNSLSLSLANTAQKTEAFLVEYQDVADMRASETVPEVDKADKLIEVDSFGDYELWKYEGDYIQFYKMFRGTD